MGETKRFGFIIVMLA